MDPIRTFHNDSIAEEKTQSGDDTGPKMWNTHTDEHRGLVLHKVLHSRETNELNMHGINTQQHRTGKFSHNNTCAVSVIFCSNSDLAVAYFSTYDL